MNSPLLFSLYYLHSCTPKTNKEQLVLQAPPPHHHNSSTLLIQQLRGRSFETNRGRRRDQSGRQGLNCKLRGRVDVSNIQKYSHTHTDVHRDLIPHLAPACTFYNYSIALLALFMHIVRPSQPLFLVFAHYFLYLFLSELIFDVLLKIFQKSLHTTCVLLTKS